MIAIVVIGVVGYGAIGFVFAANRISTADKALNTVISHQNQLNTTFHDIDARFKTLNSSTTFNPTQARAVIDEFVANSLAAGKTVNQDDASLEAAASKLGDQQWLTMISRGNLDKESTRIHHARNALSNARTVAADYVLDGQFLQAFMDAIADLDTLGTQSASGDLNGEKATITTMKTHVDKATQLSTGPGLPADLHALMLDFETLVTDLGKLVDAAQANDDAGVAANQQAVQTDGNKISAYNFDKLSTDIDAFYKPLVDGFNSEMAAATS